MTHEEVMDWMDSLIAIATWAMAVIGSIIVIGLVSGYTVEKVVQYRTDKCTNSACEQPCKPGARFVRHQGCEVTK